jgi:hypothetical protein
VKTKELYTKDHTVDLSEEPDEYPPDYQEWLDKVDEGAVEQQDVDEKAQKKFLNTLNDCPF